MARRFQDRQGFMDAAATALRPVPSSAALKGLRASVHLSASLTAVPLPQALQDWLARLRLLKGVPFGYLVPDEAMLPPESIRFFTLDMAWVDTLVDGALSIGRTLGRKPDLAMAGLEAGAADHAQPLSAQAVTRMRGRGLGLPPAAPPKGPITGFLLRSKQVSDTPGIGVNVYPQGHTPADHDRDPTVDIQLLDILRYETLGAASDVMICLVSGEAWRVDIHQPPEQLHYGIDAFAQADGGAVTATKNLHRFTQSGDQVTLSPDITKVDISTAFRSNGQRVASLSALSGVLAQANAMTALDAAEMGFAMTQGVGMVSFIRGNDK